MADDIVIRPYTPEDAEEWLRVHAIIMSTSHAWNYVLQERPSYDGYLSTQLVVTYGGRIIGMADVQYERVPGEICFLRDSLGGYVLEFGCLPDFRGRGIGTRLIHSMQADAAAKGFHRLEFWSQDRGAQRFYRRYGMREIGRHFRFRFYPPSELAQSFQQQGILVEYLYGMCSPAEWPRIQREYRVITEKPLEPRLCIGFEIRF
jgi:ribosomal protein S18 acetylase RimI-like enzyme